MELHAVVAEPAGVGRLLSHLGEPTEAPSLSPARGPPFYQSRVLRRRPQQPPAQMALFAHRHRSSDLTDPDVRSDYEEELAEAKHWQPLDEDSEPTRFIEESYQSCVDFFSSHPGLVPDSTGYDGSGMALGKVWRPQMRAEWPEVKASARKLRKARARAEALRQSACLAEED